MLLLKFSLKTYAFYSNASSSLSIHQSIQFSHIYDLFIKYYKLSILTNLVSQDFSLNAICINSHNISYKPSRCTILDISIYNALTWIRSTLLFLRLLSFIHFHFIIYQVFMHYTFNAINYLMSQLIYTSFTHV
jgi:hypothetical protein